MVKRSLREMRQLAVAQDGKCLSPEYRGTEYKLLWKCNKGHEWAAIPRTVIRGHWCPTCGHESAGKKRIKYSISDMKVLAAKRCGECISPEYLGYAKPLEWKCQDGHTWNAPPDRIFAGKWCPKCAKRKHFTEEKCRFIIEQLTGLKFPSNRKILANGQELDLYNERHRIAIEYHGIQHYEFVKGWHKDAKGFQRSRERDERKLELCDQLSIKLFVVSCKQSRTDDNLIAVLRNIAHQSGLSTTKSISMKGFYDKLSSLKALKKFAQLLGGKCLSREYIDCETKCEFQCKAGHVFKMEPRHVKAGHWCNECGNARIGDKNRRLSLSDAQDAAVKHSGECLSTTYRGSQHKLKWKCSEGHIWDASFNQIRSGRWCNLCGCKQAGKKMRATLQSVQDAAAKRGGNCLSSEYINNRTKLEFECGRGHRWMARPGNIKSGKWCPKCR